MDYDKIIDALDSVTWYNGLAEIIVQWKNDDYFKKQDDYALLWDWETFRGYDMDTRQQLEVIWMICVCMFGNYGTSPRSGWIELKNKEAFFKFVDEITTTFREDLEMR